MEITPSPSTASAAEAIMTFVSRARSFSQAVGFGERTFAAHVLLSAVEQVDLDQSSREAFLAIAEQLSDYRPLELSEQLRIRRQRRLEAQAERRARRCQRMAQAG